MSILCVAVLGLLAQGPTEELSARDALARFDALPVLRQAMLVRRLEQKVALADDPAVRRIASLRLDPGVPLPDAPAPVWFDPAEWAPVAPERRVAPPSDPRHRAVRAAMPEVTVMPDLARGVRYDWRTGSIIRARSLGWRERFANLAHGYPPGADEAYARVLAALDRDPLQRRLADYFEHLYADRDGTVWEGVTLYEAWYAGRTMEMPDVDAIAFAVQILGDRSFVSPIPADARRE
ncbi:MAG TPA: hypothetical protein VK081_15155, partial [Planctomycetota bacterium]|nr:hypothetical protein [Planctomycetota bacterium]